MVRTKEVEAQLNGALGEGVMAKLPLHVATARLQVNTAAKAKARSESSMQVAAHTNQIRTVMYEAVKTSKAAAEALIFDPNGMMPTKSTRVVTLGPTPWTCPDRIRSALITPERVALNERAATKGGAPTRSIGRLMMTLWKRTATANPKAHEEGSTLATSSPTAQ
jgi:hypothetical protein